MAPKIQHKRSAVASKAPLPTDLEYGEIAVNYEKTDPALYLKDSDNIIRRIGAPPSDASETAKGIVELATAAETTAGADSSRAVHPAGLKVELDKKAPLAGPALTGTPTAPTAAVGTDTTQIATTAFVKAAQTASSPVGSPTAPTAPTAGQVWVDSSSTPSTIKVWNGTAWIPQTGSTVTSATAPATPAAGQVWVDTSATPNVTKIWDGTAWVTTTPDAAATAALANDAKYATKAELATENTWDRTGTTLSPANAGDQVHTATGKLTVGGTAAAPSIEIKADGGIVANTNGLVYDAATKRLAIGTTSPSQLLHLSGADATALVAASSGIGSIKLTRGATAFEAYASTSACYIGTTSATDFQLRANNSEAARIDTSGRLLVGTSSARSNFFNNASIAPTIQLETTNNNARCLSLVHNSNDDGQPFLVLGKSRGTAVGSATVVSNNDLLGAVSFQGTDGSDPVEGARIQCEVDGTPGANDMPGRLVFSTTADGASSPTERVRITSTGQVRLAGAGITFNGDTATANELDDYEEGTWTPTVTNMTTTGSPAYGGRYRKIGSQVTIWFFTTTVGGVATYTATLNSTNVAGLPFASGYDGVANSGGPPGCAVNGNTTAGAFVQGPSSGASTFYFNNTISSTQGISASLTYYV